MRGEYLKTGEIAKGDLELPPRARRILFQLPVVVIPRGTTSACAENTFKQITPPPRWNYLRVRGEYEFTPSSLVTSTELPPRARRIREVRAVVWVCEGTTSACAENTWAVKPSSADSRNYLRVRGEYWWVKNSYPLHRELPPRARRIP